MNVTTVLLSQFVVLLVCVHPEDGRWLAKRVEELRICLSIYTVRANVCLFVFKQGSLSLLLQWIA